MRRAAPLLALIGIALVACGDGTPSRTLRDDVRACAEALTSLKGAPERYRDAGCPRLYRRPRCAAAWREIEPGPVWLRHVIATCAAEYCGDLEDPAPEACSEPQRSVALEELDRRILRAEGLTVEHAELFAKRVKLFLPVETAVSIDLPRPAPDPPAIQIQVGKNAGDVWIEGDRVVESAIGDELRQRAAGRGDVQVVIQADAAAQYARIVAIMAAAKQAGITRIGIATQ
jgi:biopolymer transport protein ExbD